MVIKLNYRILAFACAVFIFTGAFFIVKNVTAEDKPKGEGTYLPALMYHHVLKSYSEQGVYSVSPDEVEADIKYMQKQGYTGVFVSDLINYVEKGTELPEKPMLITFDDGYETMLSYVLPILRRNNCKAVMSVVGSYTDFYSNSDLNKNLSYANLNWDEISELSKSGLVEIQNHSYDMHEQHGERHGLRMTAGESTEQYIKALEEDITLNQEKIKAATGYYPNCFTYPYGYYTSTSEQTLRKLGFKASISCAEGVTFIEKGNPESLYRIKRYNRPHGVSSYFLDKIIAKAK